MDKKNKRQYIIAAVVLISLLISTGAGIQGENQRIELFGGVAELFLKEGSEFFDSGAYYAHNDYVELRADDNYDFAVLFPTSQNESWVIQLDYYSTGHVKDIGNPDELRIMEYYRSVEINDFEFYRAPAFNPVRHALSWCVKVSEPGYVTYLDYREVLFTREGFLHLRLYCYPEDINGALFEYVENAVTILGGNTYNDFDPATDAVSEFDFLTGEYQGRDFSETAHGRLSRSFVPVLIAVIFIFMQIVKRIGKLTRKYDDD